MPPARSNYPPGSRGAELLLRWLARTRTSQRCLARRLDVTAGTVNQWLQGQTIPTLEHAAAVEKTTSRAVRASSWAAPPRGAAGGS